MTSNGTREITFGGALNIREAPRLHAEILAAMASGEALVIDVSGVTEADVSFVQLLLAARRSADAQGKPLTLKGPVLEAVRAVLRRGGFATDDTGWLTGVEAL